MKTVYGYDIDPSGDVFVDLGDRGMESVRRTANVGSFLVDYIPSLKYLPRKISFYFILPILIVS